MDVTEQTRKAVWDGMLDTARMLRYADAMEQRYSRRRTWMRIILSIAASGGIANFLGALPSEASLVFGLAVGIVVAVDFATDYSGKLSKLMYTKMESAALLAEWEQVWLDIQTYRSEEDEIRERSKKLVEQLMRATSPMASDMRTDRKVNEEASSSAYADIALRYS